MKPCRLLSLAALALGLLVASRVFAAEHLKQTKSAAPATAGQLVKATEKDAAFLAKARASYPLKVCLTSDEKLGAHDENAEFIYREKGKPDRLVVFCCDGCEGDFKKEPATYLAKLDAAAKKEPAAK